MANRVLRIWIVTTLLAAVPVVASAETYLLVPGVPGDVPEQAHNGWIRIATVDWMTTADSSWTKGGGASVGKPNPAAIRLSFTGGPWSSAFQFNMSIGQAFAGPVIVEHVAPDGRPRYRMSMQGLFVTKYQIKSEAQTPSLDTIEAVFKTIAIEQFYVDPSGKLLSNVYNWDIPAGTASLAPPPGAAQQRLLKGG